MLNRVATENNILIAWIPGHNDINGIELADIQAKEAAATKTARLVLREFDTKRFQKPTADCSVIAQIRVLLHESVSLL